MITTVATLEYGTYDIHESRDKAVYKSQQTLLGVEDRGKNGRVFGIVKSKQMTHWAYYVNDLNPVKSLHRIESGPEPYFYFDAGQNGHPIRIHLNELKRVYKVLELI